MTTDPSPTRSSPFLRMLALGLTTRPLLSPVVLRLTLAAVMFPHGAQKALGWYGGHGWEGTMGFLTGDMVGLPAPAAMLVILLEFLGPILLALGLLTRPIAAGFIGIMIGAISKVHLPHGFFMNWSGQQAGEGYEYHILVIGMSLALLLTGAGRASVDGLLARRWAGKGG